MLQNKMAWKKFILCITFCVALLAAICPKMSSHVLSFRQEKANVICAPASEASPKVWTRETAGQDTRFIQAQIRQKNGAGRLSRTLEIFCVLLTAVLPIFFLTIYRALSGYDERAKRREAYIIRFIHAKDGEKRIVA